MSVLDICKAEVESMRDILVAYPSKDTALKLRSLLECESFNVTYVCATGASVPWSTRWVWPRTARISC